MEARSFPHAPLAPWAEIVPGRGPMTVDDLEQLPPDGFTVVCFPHKVKGGSGGWTRAVAMLD